MPSITWLLAASKADLSLFLQTVGTVNAASSTSRCIFIIMRKEEDIKTLQ